MFQLIIIMMLPNISTHNTLIKTSNSFEVIGADKAQIPNATVAK